MVSMLNQRWQCCGQGASGPITDMQGTKADPNQEEARSLGLVTVFLEQVSSLFGSMAHRPALLCLWPHSPLSPPPSPAPTFPAGLPPEARCWVNGKTTFANIKGRLFRKGRPWWGAEEACTLTRATSYLGQLGLRCLCWFPALPRGLQQRGCLLFGRGWGWWGRGPDYYPQASPAFFRDTSHWFFFFFFSRGLNGRTQANKWSFEKGSISSRPLSLDMPHQEPGPSPLQSFWGLPNPGRTGHSDPNVN